MYINSLNLAIINVTTVIFIVPENPNDAIGTRAVAVVQFNINHICWTKINFKGFELGFVKIINRAFRYANRYSVFNQDRFGYYYFG